MLSLSSFSSSWLSCLDFFYSSVSSSFLFVPLFSRKPRPFGAPLFDRESFLQFAWSIPDPPSHRRTLFSFYSVIPRAQNRRATRGHYSSGRKGRLVTKAVKDVHEHLRIWEDKLLGNRLLHAHPHLDFSPPFLSILALFSLSLSVSRLSPPSSACSSF